MTDLLTDSVDIDSNESESDNATKEVAAAADADKFCLVCNMVSAEIPNSVLLQPCRCGFWVHDQCLVSVVMHFEDRNPGALFVGCRVCRRAYNVSPLKSKLLSMGEKCAYVWHQIFCSLAVEFIVILVADITFIKMGSLTLRQIYGLDEAARIISSMSPLRAILTVQLIPAASTVVSCITWEHGCLRKLRKCSHLPLVGHLFPMEDPEVPDTFEDNPYFFQCIFQGLCLPLYANIVGRLFAWYVDNPFHCFLLGGATFLLLKGICKMYYKQKIYSRLCRLSVDNFITQHS